MDRVIGTETEADLLRVLLEALDGLRQNADEPGTITSSELADYLGLEQASGTRKLKRLLKAGVVKPAMVKRVDAWGRLRTVVGYRLAEGRSLP